MACGYEYPWPVVTPSLFTALGKGLSVRSTLGFQGALLYVPLTT